MTRIGKYLVLAMKLVSGFILLLPIELTLGLVRVLLKWKEYCLGKSLAENVFEEPDLKRQAEAIRTHRRKQAISSKTTNENKPSSYLQRSRVLICWAWVTIRVHFSLLRFGGSVLKHNLTLGQLVPEKLASSTNSLIEFTHNCRKQRDHFRTSLPWFLRRPTAITVIVVLGIAAFSHDRAIRPSKFSPVASVIGPEPSAGPSNILGSKFSPVASVIGEGIDGLKSSNAKEYSVPEVISFLRDKLLDGAYRTASIDCNQSTGQVTFALTNLFGGKEYFAFNFADLDPDRVSVDMNREFTGMDGVRRETGSPVLMAFCKDDAYKVIDRNKRPARGFELYFNNGIDAKKVGKALIFLIHHFGGEASLRYPPSLSINDSCSELQKLLKKTHDEAVVKVVKPNTLLLHLETRSWIKDVTVKIADLNPTKFGWQASGERKSVLIITCGRSQHLEVATEFRNLSEAERSIISTPYEKKTTRSVGLAFINAQDAEKAKILLESICRQHGWMPDLF